MRNNRLTAPPLALLALSALLALVAPRSAEAGEVGPCADRGPAVVVDLDRSDLWLCNQGVSEGSYSVSLGSGGLGKRRQGDNKTPVGVYSLGKPRPSRDKFHIFIPVGYPTAKQKAQGYTGSAIGIHGPKDGYRWLGPLNSLVDWTQGCIAVASVEEIEEIARWVRRNRVARVYLLSASATAAAGQP